MYDADQRGELPETAALASLGCGNPTAVAEINEGETVLDLGSGGGIDVILSAKRVGETGYAYGLDMTDEMLALARRNAQEAGVRNAIFLKGVIEEVPLPADSVDVVISNCVINLSVDKPAVLAEISRVLKPGGRIGISDVVAEDRLSASDRAERGNYVGCIAGALSKGEYEAGLDAAGFEQISVEFTHEVADGMHGAIVKAVKTSTPGTEGAAGDPTGRDRRLLLMPSDVRQITISDLRPEHWPEVARIYDEGIATGRRDVRDLGSQLGRLGLSHLEAHRLVALDEGRVVGWAAVSPVSDRCVYGGVVENSVYVAEEARGQGIGQTPARASDLLDRGSGRLDDPDRDLPREHRQRSPARAGRFLRGRSTQAAREATRRLARRAPARTTQPDRHVILVCRRGCGIAAEALRFPADALSRVGPYGRFAIREQR